jgi:hypothetical protein
MAASASTFVDELLDVAEADELPEAVPTAAADDPASSAEVPACVCALGSMAPLHAIMHPAAAISDVAASRSVRLMFDRGTTGVIAAPGARADPQNGHSGSRSRTYDPQDTQA